MDTSEALRQAETYHRQGQLSEAQRLYEAVAAADPRNFVPWHRLSTIKLQQGSHSEALSLVEQALARDPRAAHALSNRGVILHALGRFEEALASYDRALSIAPEDLDVHFNRGNSLLLLGRYQETVEAFDRVLQAQQDDGLAHYTRASALLGLERFDEAQAGYRRALALTPELAGDLCRRGAELQQNSHLTAAQACFQQVLEADPQDINATHLLGVIKAQQGDRAEALRLIGAAAKRAPNVAIIKMNYANVCAALGRHEEALASYDGALALEPDRAEAHNNKGTALRELGRFEAALTSYDAAIARRPESAEAYYNRGDVLLELGRPLDALASYDKAIALGLGSADIHNNRGNVLRELKRPEEALASYDKAVGLEPNHADACNNRGNALRDLARLEDALKSYEAALALRPDHPEAHYNRGMVLKDLKRLDEALASFGKTLALKPEHFNALGQYVFAARSMCDWPMAQRAETALIDACKLPNFSCSPFFVSFISDDPAVQRMAAEGFIRNNSMQTSAPFRPERIGKRDKLRIGYLSADFRQHPVAVLIAELIELHDRSRFEVFGFSAGPNDRSALRTRLQGAFDAFVDVRSASDTALQQAIRKAQIDIVVDVGGHTEEGRILALAQRTAPIQVTYLGYPGTVGAQFIDYAIVDRCVVPDSAARFFTEKLAYLPHSYQANDRKRAIAERVPTRSACGLPDHAFVFCCFNASYKIAPVVFDHWMRILTAVPGSVLWLLADNRWAGNNLRKEAQSRGVDPGRLVFAPRASPADHLARQGLADLFLDTWPYNAHTTASDALWVGLPVLTNSGRCFAARVAGSLLHAIGLPGLVTNSLADYEAMAIALARDPARIGAVREQLARNRLSLPLFDTDRFRRHIEAAYLQMWSLYNNGEGARTFSVPA